MDKSIFKEVIVTSLSKSYVSHWTKVEAMREFLQNALDCSSRNIQAYRGNNVLIETYDGAIPRSALLLGNSGKTDDAETIGKYGEGLKLALLIMAREEIKVTIQNGKEIWIPFFDYNEQYQCESLCIGIYEDKDNDPNKVSFLIQDLDREYMDIFEYQFISDDIAALAIVDYHGNQIFERNDLMDPNQLEDELYEDENFVAPARVYAGGLYICDLDDDFKYSYNFAPENIELDRDRMTVSRYDIQFEISKLLIRAGKVELLAKMAKNKCVDIQGYSDWQASSYSSGFGTGGGFSFKEILADIAIKDFYEVYGDNSIPISSSVPFKEKEIIRRRAVAAGYKPVEIDSYQFDMLKSKITIDEKLDSAKRINPHQELNDWLERNSENLSTEAIYEFKELVLLIDK